MNEPRGSRPGALLMRQPQRHVCGGVGAPFNPKKENPAATGQFAAGFEDSFGALSRLSLTPISLSSNPSLAPTDLSLALSLPTALSEDALIS